jgi:hypothetical protein
MGLSFCMVMDDFYLNIRIPWHQGLAPLTPRVGTLGWIWRPFGAWEPFAKVILPYSLSKFCGKSSVTFGFPA